MHNTRPRTGIIISFLMILMLLFTSCGIASTKTLIPDVEETVSAAQTEQTEAAATKAVESSAAPRQSTKAPTTKAQTETAESTLENEAEKSQEAQTSKGQSSDSKSKGSSEKESTQSENKKSGPYNYILNTNTKKFHRPKCESVDRMKEKNKWYFSGTCQEAIDMGYVPCKNCNPDAELREQERKKAEEEKSKKQEEEDQKSSSQKEEKTHDYVLNKNTKKFHYTWCRSVKQMKAKNKKIYTGTREKVIEKGYVPCKICNP